MAPELSGMHKSIRELDFCHGRLPSVTHYFYGDDVRELWVWNGFLVSLTVN